MKWSLNPFYLFWNYIIWLDNPCSAWSLSGWLIPYMFFINLLISSILAEECAYNRLTIFLNVKYVYFLSSSNFTIPGMNTGYQGALS